MAPRSKEPRISVNKLAEYLDCKAARRTKILQDQKFPQDYIVVYYKEASEAISQFLSSNMQDISILDRAIRILEQKSGDTIQAQRRINGNIDAIENFQLMADDIDFGAMEPSLGASSPDHLKIRGVSISVRPEITLIGRNKRGQIQNGAIKLHFSKNFALSEDASAYVSAILNTYTHDFLMNDGAVSSSYCHVIDVGSRTIWPGVKAVRQRMKDVEEACAEIADRWKLIQQP